MGLLLPSGAGASMASSFYPPLISGNAGIGSSSERNANRHHFFFRFTIIIFERKKNYNKIGVLLAVCFISIELSFSCLLMRLIRSTPPIISDGIATVWQRCLNSRIRCGRFERHSHQITQLGSELSASVTQSFAAAFRINPIGKPVARWSRVSAFFCFVSEPRTWSFPNTWKITHGETKDDQLRRPVPQDEPPRNKRRARRAETYPEISILFSPLFKALNETFQTKINPFQSQKQKILPSFPPSILPPLKLNGKISTARIIGNWEVGNRETCQNKQTNQRRTVMDAGANNGVTSPSHKRNAPPH